jgi:hypothetical protein
MVHTGAAAAIADRGEELVRYVPALYAVCCLPDEAFCNLDQLRDGSFL